MNQTKPNPDIAVGPALSTWLVRLCPGESQQVGSLSFVPLLLEGAPGRRHLLVDQAIARGVVSIREDGRGQVGRVLAENTGAAPVLVLAGETLVGCKQNRVVIRSAILPGHSEQRLEVRCIEQDRWAWSSHAFSTGSMRATDLLRSSRWAGNTIDQRGLWDEIGTTLAGHGLRSATGDYHALLEERSDALRRVAARIRLHDDQVGTVVVHRRRVFGLELTDHPDTWRQVADRTLPAYLLAVERERGPERVEPHDPARIARDSLPALCCIGVQNAAPVEPAIEVGVSGAGLTGTALWYDHHPIYLSAQAGEDSRWARP